MIEGVRRIPEKRTRQPNRRRKKRTRKGSPQSSEPLLDPLFDPLDKPVVPRPGDLDQNSRFENFNLDPCQASETAEDENLDQ
jgi:hypothetical protein